MTDITVSVAQYLVFVHMMACVLVLFQHILIGFKVNSATSKRIKYSIWMCRAIPLIQIPVSAVRLYYLSEPGKVLLRPVETYLDFVWSPMLTIILIWLIQLYLAKYCCRINKVTKPISISSPIKPVMLFPTFIAGITTSAVLWPLYDSFNYSAFSLIMGLFSVATVMSMFEMALFRYFHEGTIVITSYSWVWYVGTWVLFAYKAT